MRVKVDEQILLAIIVYIVFINTCIFIAASLFCLQHECLPLRVSVNL